MSFLNHLTTNVRIAMGAVLLTLISATIIAKVFSHNKQSKKWEEIQTRVESWWVIIFLVFAAIVIGKITTTIFLAFVSFLALREYLSLVPTRKADRRVLFWAFLAVPVQFYLAYTNWYGMFITFLPVYFFLFIPLRMLITGETQDFLRAASTIQWGLMLTVFSISHIAFLMGDPAAKNPIGGWEGLILFLLIITEVNDIAQFISGKMFGSHKILPSVSPNKTVEGLIGGMIITTTLSFFLAPLLTPIQSGAAIGFGLVLSLFGFVGDVTISAVKRDIGVKDAGSIIPGHGGILDRVDSLTYTAPLFYHMLWFYINRRG